MDNNCTQRSGEWTHWSEHILETHIIFFNYRLPNYKTKVQVAYSSCSHFSIFSTILLHCLLNTIPTIAVPARSHRVMRHFPKNRLYNRVFCTNDREQGQEIQLICLFVFQKWCLFDIILISGV